MSDKYASRIWKQLLLLNLQKSCELEMSLHETIEGKKKVFDHCQKLLSELHDNLIRDPKSILDELFDL